MALIQDYNKLFEYTDNIKKVILNGNVVWPTKKSESGPDYTEPFYVENITNENETLSITKNGSSAPTLTIQYSTDKTTWNTLGNTSTSGLTKTLAPGEKIYLRCNTNAWFGNSLYNRIRGVSKAGGNIMSLLYGSSFDGTETSFSNSSNHNFCSLFYNNANLVDVSELLLPATTLTKGCYTSMFAYCRSLTTTPELPATTLTNNCYGTMFRGCTSLITAPALPATTLVSECYYNMFNGCTSLNTVNCLATSGINENKSTYYWLSEVSSTGTFTKAAGVTWPSGVNGIPEGWTVVEV